MAQAPGGAKGGKSASAPMQFDMNKRDGKFSGKGKPGGMGRGRDDAPRAPSRIESLPPSIVDRGPGFVITKVARVDLASRAPVGAEYFLAFEGHDPIPFAFLKAARDRSKEPAPEKLAPAEAALEPTSAVELSETLVADETVEAPE